MCNRQSKGAAVSDKFRSIDPRTDPRWERFVQSHPRASIFHSPQWLEALSRTYGYSSLAFTTARDGEELRNGTVFCQVESWLVRPRLVSLPFSDHADPLMDDPEDLLGLVEFLTCESSRRKWHSIEMRPPHLDSALRPWGGLGDGHEFLLHRLNLQPSGTDLFGGLHKDSIQRKVRRAERERLQYQEGRNEELLRAFYELTVMTRSRQGLPPQPYTWFRNVLDCLGENAKLRVASKDGRPIAAIFTLHYKRAAVYKYGCSDARWHSLGGMPLVLWRAIEDAKASGAAEFDFGRSDLGNRGLITFKEKFGAQPSRLAYKKFPNPSERFAGAQWADRTMKRVFAAMPEKLQVLAGKIIYPHIG